MPPAARLSARTRRAAALLGAAALGLVLAPVRARAQPAACAAASLATYLSAGFACGLDGWTFADFAYDPFLSPPEDPVAGLSASVPAAADVGLRPFAEAAPRGARRFGFALDGFRSAFRADGVTAAEPLTLALPLLRFTARRAAPGPGVAGVAADVAVEVDNATPGALGLRPTASASAFDADRFAACLIEGFSGGEPPGTARGTLAGGCPLPADGVEVILGHTLILSRGAGTGTAPLTGATAAAVERVTLTTAARVVPEPAPLALSAAGAVTLLGIARRRRGARRA